MVVRRTHRKVGGSKRVSHKRHVGRGTKYVGGRRRRHHRMRGAGGYDIVGQIPLLGGLMQAIGNAVHGGSTDW